MDLGSGKRGANPGSVSLKRVSGGTAPRSCRGFYILEVPKWLQMLEYVHLGSKNRIITVAGL